MVSTLLPYPYLNLKSQNHVRERKAHFVLPRPVLDSMLFDQEIVLI